MTEPSFRHLEDAELNDLADGTASGPPPEWLSHLRWCPSCRERLDRLRDLLERASHLTPELDPGREGWAALRSAIPAQSPRATRLKSWLPIGLAAAVIIGLAYAALFLGTRPRDIAALGEVDSSRASSRQSKTEQDLLAELELERGLLRPETVDELEDDLKVINAAVAELEAAIARDPANPTLRRLLAASDEQKAALLKRLGNAS
jgi:hypothetical protein